MEISPIIPGDRQVIGAYGAGLFRVSGIAFDHSVLVFPARTLAWPVTAFSDIDADCFSPVLEADPAVEVLLLGTGARHEFVPPALRRQLRESGIVLDSMDTGAACRTYNVLMAEDRRVAAALIALD